MLLELQGKLDQRKVVTMFKPGGTAAVSSAAAVVGRIHREGERCKMSRAQVISGFTPWMPRSITAMDGQCRITNLPGTIYLVDDDPQVRRSIGRLLCATGHRVQEFESCRCFLDAVDEQTPGCLLVDLQLPDIDGLELQRLLAGGARSWPIVFLTGHATISASVQAMKAGAVDFLTKPVERCRLLAAVSEALAADAVQRDQIRARAMVRERIARLSPREYEVLFHLVRGRLNKQIAGDLGVVEKTIKVHRGRVLKKMGVRSLVELAQMVSVAGIIANWVAPRSAEP